jgi:DNA polymerase-3 subunit epsilon
MRSPLLKPIADQPLDWPGLFEQKGFQANFPGQLAQFYQAGCPEADTPLDQVEFLAMDFETTGLDVERDSILSIGVVPFTLGRIRYSQSQHWLIQPHRDLKDETVVIHGITHTDVSDADPLRAVFSELLPMMQGRVMVVHYKNIERSFLNRASLKLFDQECLFPLVDTMAIEKRLCRQSLPSKLKALLRMSPDSVRLANSRERYHLPAYPAHHALTDALATAELLVAQLSHLEANNLPISQVWE